MAFERPQRRVPVRQIQTQKRNIPLEQIIAVQGRSPVSTGIETLGNLVGTALTKRAELQRQGQQLAALEQLSGQQPGSYSGLDPSIATSLATSQVKQRSDNFSPAQMNAIASGDLSNMSSAFPMGVPKEAVTASLSKSRTGNLESERETRKDERLSTAAINYWKTLETNPVIKTLKQQDIGLAQVDQLIPLIESGNTIAANAVGIKMARGMGEVGVITDQDVVRYVQSGQLTRAAGDKLSRMIKGVPTEATLEEMSEITNVLRDGFNQKIQPLYNDAVLRFARNYKISPEEAADRLVIPYTSAKSKPEPLKPITQPTISPVTPRKVGRFTIEVE